MKAMEVNFREFITTGRRTFSIPVYQRNYEWKEPECSRLFSDIEAIAGGSGSHFVGTIVYVTSENSNATWSEFTVIDGQQRITTVLLLLKAIHELTDSDDIKDEIWDDYLTNKRAREEKYRLKLKPIESDAITWNQVIDGNEPENISSNLWKNYELFRRKVNGSSFSPQEIFEAIGKLEIVYIQLETGKENPQVIFESINSTGLDLTEGDKIRNFLLMNCDSQEKQLRLYKDYWVKIEQYLTPQIIPNFVRDYLTMKRGELTNKNAVYETFKKFFRSYYDGTEEDVLKELCRFAEYYFWFRSLRSNNDELNFLLRQFHEMRSFVAFPFMLWIFDKCYNENRISKEQLHESLNTLLCYQYRRIICKYSTNALNSTYTVLSREIGNAEDIPKKLLDILTKKVRTQTFPRNEEFKAAFATFDLYSAKLAKYTLAMLENKMSPREQVSLTALITIEHIMPQTLSTTWKADLGKDFEQIQAQWLHTAGNLTLSGSNPELGNKSFSEKKIVFATSNFALSRELAAVPAWLETNIKERGNKLAEMALQIWSLPDGYNTTKSDSEIDYSTSYNIMDNIRVTGEKPRSYINADTEKSVDSWKALFFGVCRDLYSLDSATFDKVVRHEVFVNRHLAEPINSDYQFRIKSNEEICPGYYAETNFSAQDFLTFTQIVAEVYNWEEELFFTFKRNYANQRNNSASSEEFDTNPILKTVENE